MDYDDTPNASGKELIDQAWEVDKAIITTLKAANAPAYKSIVDGMIASRHRLDAERRRSEGQCLAVLRLPTAIYG